MKLQISFDTSNIDQALEDCKKVADYCDIIEIGNLTLITEGISVIKKFKEASKKPVLVDSKILAKGEITADFLIRNGADYITVMAGASKNTIHAATNSANSLNKRVMLDISDAQSQGQSALEASNLGMYAIIFNQVYDLNEPHIFLEKWEMVKGNTDLPIFIGGKINKDSIHQIIELKPDGIILGKAITDAEDVAEEAKFFYQLINK